MCVGGEDGGPTKSCISSEAGSELINEWPACRAAEREKKPLETRAEKAEKREPRDEEADTSISKTLTGVRCSQEIHRRVCRHSKEGKEEDLPPSSSLAFTEIKETLIGKSCSDSVTEHSVLLSALLSFFLWVVVVVVVVCASVLLCLTYLCCFLSPFPSLSSIHPSNNRKAYHPPSLQPSFPSLTRSLPPSAKRKVSITITPPHRVAASVRCPALRPPLDLPRIP